MKKTIYLLLLSLCFVLVGCGFTLGKGDTLSRSEIDVICEEAITGVNAIESSVARRFAKRAVSDVEFNPSDVLNKVSGFMETNVSVEETQSDREGYSIKRIITINETIYTIYISNVNSSTEEDIEDDETETEYKKTYDGIIILNDIEYEFRACEKTETEVEDDETETETKLDMYIKLGEDKYIKVKQTSEVEVENGIEEKEEKFEVQLREGKQKTVLFKIKRSIEDGEEQIKLEMNNVEYKVKYYSIEDVNYVDIKVDDAKYSYVINVDELGNVTYDLVNND